MKRYLPMVMFVILISGGLGGCMWRPELRSAPLPTPAEVKNNLNFQTRLIKVPFESIFPKAIVVLMDNGFIIRSADKEFGIISYCQQWVDKEQRDTNFSQEGTIFFEKAGADTTRIRVIMTGSWQIRTIGGKHSADSMVGELVPSPGAEQYKAMLDALEKGLLAGKEK